MDMTDVVAATELTSNDTSTIASIAAESDYMDMSSTSAMLHQNHRCYDKRQGGNVLNVVQKCVPFYFTYFSVIPHK